MRRLLFLTFFGEPRSERARHAHESPTIMTAPLIVLAPFMWGWDSAGVLLVAQAVLLALAGIPIYLWARQELGPIAGLAFLGAEALLGAVLFLYVWVLLSLKGRSSTPRRRRGPAKASGASGRPLGVPSFAAPNVAATPQPAFEGLDIFDDDEPVHVVVRTASAGV